MQLINLAIFATAVSAAAIPAEKPEIITGPGPFIPPKNPLTVTGPGPVVSTKNPLLATGPGPVIPSKNPLTVTGPGPVIPPTNPLTVTCPGPVIHDRSLHGGPGPVQSGGSCAANDASTPRVARADCQAALSELRARGDNDHVACDKMFRPTFDYLVKGNCKVVTVANGNPQCANPKILRSFRLISKR